MPFGFARLLLFACIRTKVLINRLLLLGADNANLVVLTSQSSYRIDDRMYVQFGSRRLPCQLAKFLGKNLLQIIGEGILLPEEDNTALGN